MMGRWPGAYPDKRCGQHRYHWATKHRDVVGENQDAVLQGETGGGGLVRVRGSPNVVS
jgi:hypothetical protein